LPFQGERYVGNPTVPPARQLGLREMSEVLIKAEDPGDAL